MDASLWPLVSGRLYTKAFSVWWSSYKDGMKPVVAEKQPFPSGINPNVNLNVHVRINTRGKRYEPPYPFY